MVTTPSFTTCNLRCTWAVLPDSTRVVFAGHRRSRACGSHNRGPGAPDHQLPRHRRSWDGVPEDVRPYWCPRALWPAMADAIAGVAAREKVRIEVTFDDGNLSDAEEALPVLLERQVTATFDICAGRIGEPHS
jgi:hypothetical protein